TGAPDSSRAATVSADLSAEGCDSDWDWAWDASSAIADVLLVSPKTSSAANNTEAHAPAVVLRRMRRARLSMCFTHLSLNSPERCPGDSNRGRPSSNSP